MTLLEASPGELPHWAYELLGTALFSMIAWLINRGVKGNDDKAKALAEQNADQGKRIVLLETERASLNIKLEWLNSEIADLKKASGKSVDRELFEAWKHIGQQEDDSIRAAVDQCLFELGRKPSTRTVRAMIGGKDPRSEPMSEPPEPPRMRPRDPSVPGRRGSGE
jgi:hypothetical protein